MPEPRASETRPSVYLETSVIGYATSRPSRDLVVAAHQQITSEWFAVHAGNFELFISRFVVQEISQGDETAAAERLAFIQPMAELAVTTEAEQLAAALLVGRAVPAENEIDALHIAVAAVHGVDYLVTWNFKHIANPTRRLAIEQVCEVEGRRPPTICSPEGLIHGNTRRSDC